MPSTENKSQTGFVLLPIILIASAIIAGVTAVGVGFYLKQKNTNEFESLSNEVANLTEQLKANSMDNLPTPTPELSTAIRSPRNPASTDQQASNAIPDTSVPATVEQEFKAIYGRNPSATESSNWKAQVRSNNWTVSQLQVALKSTQVRTASQEAPQPTQQPLMSKREQCDLYALSAKSKFVIQLEEIKAKYEPEFSNQYNYLIVIGEYEKAALFQAQWEQQINNINNAMTHAYDIALSNCLNGNI